MKIKLITLLSFCLLSLSGFAQEKQHENNGRKDEKIKALYIAYMTEQLNLNESEAQKFWPLHKEYNTELKSVRKENLSELDAEEAMLNVRKKYNEKFFRILGKERTDVFYKKDREFRDKVVKKIREKRNEAMKNRKEQSNHQPNR